jgi:hypothetical protein
MQSNFFFPRLVTFEIIKSINMVRLKSIILHVPCPGWDDKTFPTKNKNLFIVKIKTQKISAMKAKINVYDKHMLKS